MPDLYSNTSRPQPRADTGSLVRNVISDAFTFLLRMERRIDPWVRPFFDAVLRDPLARLTTGLINAQRPNEGLKLAEERLLPDEEEFLASIIDTFGQQMRKLWKPGGFERGGNTKTHGIVRGEFIVHDNLPPQFRHGIYAKPQTFPRLGALFRSRPLHHAGHRRRRFHEHQHQAHGRAGTEADGGGKAHARHVRRLARRRS